MGRKRVAVAAVALGTALLAGCTGTSGSSGSADFESRDSAGGVAQAAPAEAPSTAPSATRGSASRQSQSLVATQSKIRTASLTVTVTDAKAVSTRADNAVDLAVRVGGEVDTDDRSGGRGATATLRLRVPPDQLEPTLRALARFGKASSREVSSRDVTGQVADVTSRVESAQRAIARLRALYGDATRVSDVIAVEQELSSREADLESLQAQQRALAGQTSLATITLYLRAAPAAAKVHHDRTGFLGGLANGWDAFTGALAGLATGFGAALPFLVVLALFALAGRLVWRRTRRPAPQPATE